MGRRIRTRWKPQKENVLLNQNFEIILVKKDVERFGCQKKVFLGQKLESTNIKLRLKSNLKLKSNVETRTATFGGGDAA